MTRIATLVLLPLLAVALAGCSDRGEDQLMRRVAQAEEAAKKAEAAAARAEDAARLATGGSTVPESVYEEAPESDEAYGEATEPVPLDS